MLRAAPGTAFEAFTSGFATGLTGTLGVRLRDGAGADAIARTTVGIHEDIAGSGVYRVTLTAPETAGQYWLIWDNGSGGFSVPEQLLVTTSLLEPTVPSGRDLCTLEDVIALVPGYELGDEPATEDTLALKITQESIEFMETTRCEVTAKDATPERIYELDWVALEERELAIDDAAEITGVELRQADGTVVQTLASASWVELERTREVWESITSLAFPIAVAEPAQLAPGLLAAVTATWGFPEIPTTVRRSVAGLVIVRYLSDTAAEGTAFAEAANRAEFNIGAAIRQALDARKRFFRPKVA